MLSFSCIQLCVLFVFLVLSLFNFEPLHADPKPASNDRLDFDILSVRENSLSIQPIDGSMALIIRTAISIYPKHRTLSRLQQRPPKPDLHAGISPDRYRSALRSSVNLSICTRSQIPHSEGKWIPPHPSPFLPLSGTFTLTEEEVCVLLTME